MKYEQAVRWNSGGEVGGERENTTSIRTFGWEVLKRQLAIRSHLHVRSKAKLR